MSGNKISLSLGAARKAPPPPTNGVKRPRAALHDDDDHGANDGRAESVSHFDKSAGGAIDERKEKEKTGPLSIAPQANRDWREKANQRKRQKSGLPEGAGKREDLDQRMRDVEARVEASKPKFGLNVYQKDNAETVAADAVRVTSPADLARTEAVALQADVEIRPKTNDELAMDALLGITTTDKTLTIPAVSESMTEEDAYIHDASTAPAMATLDDYERVPVEQFGAALLRGMGWKDGEGIGSQKGQKLSKDSGKLPARRANLLGIGAKEEAAVAQEIGAWGKGARGKEVKIYNPVILKSKTTGQMYTEEELEKKKQDDEQTKYEREYDERQEKRREQKRRDDDDYDSRDRRREGETSRESRRHRDRSDRDDRRDRSRERRKFDSESDGEYARRREKERRRRHERTESDRQRERSHRHHDEDRRDRRDRDRDRRR